jgi:hypothetical protein
LSGDERWRSRNAAGSAAVAPRTGWRSAHQTLRRPVGATAAVVVHRQLSVLRRTFQRLGQQPVRIGNAVILSRPREQVAHAERSSRRGRSGARRPCGAGRRATCLPAVSPSALSGRKTRVHCRTVARTRSLLRFAGPRSRSLPSKGRSCSAGTSAGVSGRTRAIEGRAPAAGGVARGRAGADASGPGRQRSARRGTRGRRPPDAAAHALVTAAGSADHDRHGPWWVGQLQGPPCFRQFSSGCRTAARYSAEGERSHHVLAAMVGSRAESQPLQLSWLAAGSSAAPGQRPDRGVGCNG